eukprot:30728_1
MEIGEREQTVFKYEDIQLLVGGYCNNNFKHQIPSVIMDILVMYLNSVVYCHLDGDNLQSFLSTRCGARYFTQKLTIEGIELEYNIYPNGHKVSDCGLVTFYLSVLLFPSHILGITLYCELFCNQINFKKKAITTFSANKTRWYPIKFLLSDIKSKQSLQSLNLNCFVDILRIKYKNKNHPPFDCQKGMKMSRITHYKWKLDEQTKNKMKSTSILYSYTFDHCWCLYCESFNQSGRFNLQLLKLPFGVSDIQIKCQYHHAKYDQEEKQKKEFHGIQLLKKMSYYSTVARLCGDKNTQILEAWAEFGINIEIVQLWDMHNQKIDESKWHLYLYKK